MRISRVRSQLYKTARALGDVQAVGRGTVSRRIARRAVGKLTGRTLMRWLFP